LPIRLFLKSSPLKGISSAENRVGNTADPTTVIDQADKLADQFGLSQVVFVADRGMLGCQAQTGDIELAPENCQIFAYSDASHGRPFV
jgi:hypothetical protein